MRTVLIFGVLFTTLLRSAAQVSVPVERSYGSMPTDKRSGPFFLNDTVVVFLHEGRLFSVGTSANEVPLRVASPTQLGSLVQSPDGRVYAIPGGTCDVVPVFNVLYQLTGTTVGDLALEEVIRFADDLGAGSRERDALAVGRDGVAWIVHNGKLSMAYPATGRVSSFPLLLNDQNGIGTEFLALDSVRAVYVDRGTAFYLRIFRNTISRTPVARGVVSASVGVEDGEIRMVSRDSLVVLDVTTAERTRTARALPVPGERVILAAPDLVLIQGRGTGRLLRWTPSTGDTSSRVYYLEVAGWGLHTARVSASGKLAVRANDQDRLSFTTDFPIPVSQSFVQVIPAGVDPTLMGPPVTFDVAFRNATDQDRFALAYDVAVSNESDALVGEALIVGSDPFGPCADFYNEALIEDLPAGQTAVAVVKNRFYYMPTSGRAAQPGDRIDVTFKVVYVNGRPTGSGTNVRAVANYFVSSLRDIAHAPDVKLYPSLASTSVTVEYADPRQELLVIDALGRVAVRQKLDPTQTRATIDVSSFGESLYYLLLTTATGTSVHPFTVHH